VSAERLQSKSPPSTLKKALAAGNPDAPIWDESYNEEYDGLTKLDTFEVLTKAQYDTLPNQPKAIPTMCVLTIKVDEWNRPVRAKSRIVVLGNLEDHAWTKADCYAPVLRQDSLRLLILIAVQVGCVAKQGDCKNAFYQPRLPDDEVVIVMPPPGCPRSEPFTYWRLRKTLYGLQQSPCHWYENFKMHLLSIGFKACTHDPCIFIGHRPAYPNDPIYVGCYVDGFIYFSTDSRVEDWFEASLASRISVEFMGPVCWFLGISFYWNVTPEGMWVHLSQAGFVHALLLKYELDRVNAVKAPYRSGLCIDRIPKPSVDAPLDPDFVQQYQSLMGCITWLFTSTRPDLGVSMKLLSAHTHRPGPGHMEAGKHVLCYLKSSSERGLLYRSVGLPTGTSELNGVVSYPFCNHEDPIGFFDSNWGPQDASHPTGEADDTLNVEEARSLQGALIVRMGGAIAWKEMREKRVSRATCEVEIKSLDKCTRLVLQALQLVLEDLGMSDIAKPTLIYNNNQGSVDWSKGWANRRM
jgi:hypothetical protein